MSEPKEELILNTLTEPMTREDLIKKSGLPEYRISEITRKLEREERLMRFRLQGNVGSKYRSFEIFGNLTNELYFYKPGQEEDVANLIIQNIPPREKISVHMKHSVIPRLKRCLPKQVFEKVYAYYIFLYTPSVHTDGPETRGINSSRPYQRTY